MKGTKVVLQDHRKGGRVVFSITAAQLQQLRHPESRLARYRKSRRDPRDPLVEKGLLRSYPGANGEPWYERTKHGDAVMRALDHKEE